nr:hypothetical protein [Hungatella effluvii]
MPDMLELLLHPFDSGRKLSFVSFNQADDIIDMSFQIVLILIKFEDFGDGKSRFFKALDPHKPFQLSFVIETETIFVSLYIINQSGLLIIPEC